MFFISYQTNRPKRWYPSLEFTHPVVQCRLRYQNHMRTRNISIVFHVPKERNCLKSLSQTLKDFKIITNEKQITVFIFIAPNNIYKGSSEFVRNRVLKYILVPKISKSIHNFFPNTHSTQVYYSTFT